MKTYQYHSMKFGSEVQVSYNKFGILSGFTVISSSLVEKLHSQDRQFANFFYEADFINAAKANSLKITEVERKVTFQMFWEAYKQKDCGVTKCEQVWNRLSKIDQIEAYEFIAAFNGIIKLSGLSKPYATTYLNQKRWIR